MAFDEREQREPRQHRPAEYFEQGAGEDHPEHKQSQSRKDLEPTSKPYPAEKQQETPPPKQSWTTTRRFSPSRASSHKPKSATITKPRPGSSREQLQILPEAELEQSFAENDRCQRHHAFERQHDPAGRLESARRRWTFNAINNEIRGNSSATTPCSNPIQKPLSISVTKMPQTHTLHRR